MKFGKEFKTHLEETLPEWRDKFLCYKPLKKLLKQLPPTVDSLNLDRPINFQLHPHPLPLTGDVHGNTNRPLVDLQEWFVSHPPESSTSRRPVLVAEIDCWGLSVVKKGSRHLVLRSLGNLTGLSEILRQGTGCVKGRF
jgi:hypothetical protein